MRAIAKAVVKRESEDKFVSTAQNLQFNSTIGSAAECYAMVPQITQGTDDYQRIGDKVRGKYLYIKGMVQYDESYLNTVGVNTYIPPVTCRALILSQKNIKVGSEVSTRVDVAHLLKDNVGTGTARSYAGTTWDNVAPINKDLFRVHMDKKIKLNWVQHYSYTGGGNSTEAVGAGTDHTKYFSCRVKVPATLTFDNGNGSWPNNFAPFFCFGSVCDDGSSPYTVGTPFRVRILSTLYFEDA